MSIGIQANRQKIAVLLEYLATIMPNVQLRKLLKILYLIDEESVKSRAIPVTWLDYYAWKKGPVAPEIYEMKNGAFSDYVTCVVGDDGKWHVSSIKTAPYLIDKDMEIMSDYERQIIDRVLLQYMHKSADELTEETHMRDSLWSQVVEENKIDFSDNSKSEYIVDLNRINDNDASLKEIYADAMDVMQMQAFLIS